MVVIKVILAEVYKVVVIFDCMSFQMIAIWAFISIDLFSDKTTQIKIGDFAEQDEKVVDRERE